MWLDLLTTKSLFSLFPAGAVEAHELEKYVRQVKSGEILCIEGSSAKQLIIPIDADVYLFHKSAGKEIKIGNLAPGRSANLYCFLKGLPFQYSACVQTSGRIFEISREKFSEFMIRFPSLENYLLKVTESESFLRLSKQIRSQGMSSPFAVEFIEALTEEIIKPNNYILSRDVPANKAAFLTEGKFVKRSRASVAKSWLAPLNSWVGWPGLDDAVDVLAVGKSTYLSLLHDKIKELRSRYPDDYSKMDSWVRAGSISFKEDVDLDGAEVENVKDLFLGSVAKSSWQFKYPWVQQNDEMDCGAACLSMLSQYFGKDLNVPFWRSRLSTDKMGTSLYDMASTSENAGFISHCLEVASVKEVDKFLLPFIALRKYHYIVVYDYGKTHVTVGDPAIGVRKISHAEFEQGFEKVGLFLKPGADFSSLEESSSSWRHYLHFFQGLRGDLSLAFICSALGVLVSLVPPVLSQVILDDILVQKNFDLFWIVLAVSLGTVLLNSLIQWAESYYYIFIINKFNFRATSVFVQKMLSLPYQFFASRHVGDFTQRLGEISQLRSFVTNTLFGTVLSLLMISIYVVALCLINLKAAFVAIAMMPVLAFIPFFSTKILSRQWGEIFTRASEKSSYVTDLVKGIATIKSSGGETVSRLRFERKMLDLVKAESKFSFTALGVHTASSAYHQIMTFAIMGITVNMGMNGEMTVGQVISFSLIAGSIFSPLLALAKQWENFVEMKAVLGRLNDIFLSPSDSSLVKTGNRAKGTDLVGEIEFKDVWFRYGGEATDWVLKGVSFKIEQGQKVGIVGPSGSGKSTIAMLLTRMYEPTQGQIFIAGRDYREYDVRWLRDQVGLLLQESFLFEGSIAENIAFNTVEPNEEKLLRAIECAGASSLVEKKGGPFNGYVAHGGLGFSGGEKQKLSLARLFYQGPQILILDEATSALDGISEKEVLGQIRHEMSDKTILNIAHKLSTVKESDFVLVMNEGMVVDFGPVQHIAQNCLLFRKLFNLSLGAEALNDEEKRVA